MSGAGTAFAFFILPSAFSALTVAGKGAKWAHESGEKQRRWACGTANGKAPFQIRLRNPGDRLRKHPRPAAQFNKRRVTLNAVKERWHTVPLAAVIIAAFSLAFGWYIGDRGYLNLIVNIFGYDFGITRVKAHNQFFWFGQPHPFPLDAILYATAFVAAVVAIFFTIRHFVLERGASED